MRICVEHKTEEIKFIDQEYKDGEGKTHNYSFTFNVPIAAGVKAKPSTVSKGLGHDQNNLKDLKKYAPDLWEIAYQVREEQNTSSKEKILLNGKVAEAIGYQEERKKIWGFKHVRNDGKK